jgi:hypothetical protein
MDAAINVLSYTEHSMRGAIQVKLYCWNLQEYD